jgi:hypothetical protein
LRRAGAADAALGVMFTLVSVLRGLAICVDMSPYLGFISILAKLAWTRDQFFLYIRLPMCLRIHSAEVRRFW